MNRLAHIVPLLTALACLLGMVSCSDDSCYDNGSSLPLATLCMDGSQTTISGLTIKGIDAPGDSLLVDSSSISQVYLPLRASVSSTAYAFSRWVTIDTVNTLVRDTIFLDYKPIEFFHSAECGAMFNFDINNVRHTRHGIDSIVVITPLVTNSYSPALSIYFTDF